jgi:uncharacterized protein YjgD (DUF1641 family)
MAAPLDYAYPPGPDGPHTFTAADDLARLLETLHTSGVLRLANGLVARFQDVAAVALDGLATEEGHNALANVLLLGKALGAIDADGTARVVDALALALPAAAERLTAETEPPGTVALLRRMREPDVRRGLDAALTLLGTLGARLSAPPAGGHP